MDNFQTTLLLEGGVQPVGKFQTFLKSNKPFWLWFNMVVFLCSILFGVLSYFNITNEEETDCGVLKFA